MSKSKKKTAPAVSFSPDVIRELENAHRLYDRCMAIMASTDVSVAKGGEAFEALMFLKIMRDKIKQQLDSMLPKEKFKMDAGTANA